MKKAALLIIDMQKGSFTPLTCRYDSINIIRRINNLSERFRAAQLPVIHIQHDGSAMGEFIKGNKDWEIIDELYVNEEDFRVDKTANDAFYNSDLDALLKRHDINQLYITGCATDFCVEATLQSGLTKDYNIIVISDGHTTADRPHLKAEKIIEHYNWLWRELMPTKGSVSVIAMKDIGL